jgi:hypothetical protein
VKARRNLYIILGALTSLFYFGGMYLLFTEVKREIPDIESFNYIVITNQLWLVIAVLLFRAAYRIQKKINQQKRQTLENAFAD